MMSAMGRDCGRGGDREGAARARSFAMLLIMVMLLSTLPLMAIAGAAQGAATVIDLEIDDGYDTPFSVKDLKPGDVGSKVVALRNVGSEDGQVAIWVSDIQETDGGEDGAHLDDYMLFEVSAPELSSNLHMPGIIREFPSSAFGSPYIWVLNVRAGETIEVVWYWEFMENYQPQNEAQGDGLSFTINYLLGIMPPPSQGMSWLEVDVLGQITTALLDEDSRTMEPVQALDASKSVSLQIPEGARCVSENGSTVTRVEVARVEKSVAMGVGRAQIGPIHVVTAYDSDGMEAMAFLDAMAVLRVNYDSALLPSITRTIGLYMYSESGGWQPLATAVDEPSYIGQCAGLFNRTGDVGVIATYDPQESAYFLPSDLDIEPSQQTWWDPIIFATRVGELVRVSVILTNIGEVQGTKNVTLAIDGVITSSEQIVLGPLERREVTFEIRGLSSGEHSFEVSGLSGRVLIGTQVNWWLIVGFIFLCVATVVGTAYSASSWKEMRSRMKHLHGSVMDVESKLLESEMAMVAMRERQKAVATVSTPPAVQPTTLPDSPDPLLDGIDARAVGASSPDNEFDPAGASAPVAVPSIQPTPTSPVDGAPVRTAVAGADVARAAQSPVEALQQEEDVEARKIRVAKSFILLTIQNKGQLSIDEVPRKKSAEVAMQALSQLIEEGKIRAIQQEHRVIYLLNS